MSADYARQWCGLVLRAVVVVVLLNVVPAVGESVRTHGPENGHLFLVSILCFWMVKVLRSVDGKEEQPSDFLALALALAGASKTAPPASSDAATALPPAGRRRECLRKGQSDSLWLTAA